MTAGSHGKAATFVLVHGAWHGGWCYARVAAALRARGHVVFTPTLTGQGERSHLLDGTVNLSLHITDILNVFRYEGLRGVVLCGHSYGGMVITGVADQIPELVSALVYLDAFVPEDGQSLFDINIAANNQTFLARAGAIGGLAVPPPGAAFFNVNAQDRARVDELATPHPLGAFTERIKLTGAYRSVRKRVYVHGTELPRQSPFRPFYERAKSDPSWSAHALACGHDVMLDMPGRIVEILQSVV
jgi:pimeloyl-ACP methyl ester carboxylesterase